MKESTAVYLVTDWEKLNCSSSFSSDSWCLFGLRFDFSRTQSNKTLYLKANYTYPQSDCPQLLQSFQSRVLHHKVRQGHRHSWNDIPRLIYQRYGLKLAYQMPHRKTLET